MSDTRFDPARIGDLGELIPHAGGMCLLEAVLAWDEQTIRCTTHSHRDPRNPLRSGDRLSALHLCEYGAQAMAVHGGLLARRDGGLARPGMLVSLREVRLHVQRIDGLDGGIDVEATRLLGSADHWQYGFRVLHRATLLAEGRAAVVLGPVGPTGQVETP